MLHLKRTFCQKGYHALYMYIHWSLYPKLKTLSQWKKKKQNRISRLLARFNIKYTNKKDSSLSEISKR
jgi:hypothetical protein